VKVRKQLFWSPRRRSSQRPQRCAVKHQLLLLHAPTKQEAIALLERLRTEISIAVVDSRCRTLAVISQTITFLPTAVKIMPRLHCTRNTSSARSENWCGCSRGESNTPGAWLQTVQTVFVDHGSRFFSAALLRRLLVNQLLVSTTI